MKRNIVIRILAAILACFAVPAAAEQLSLKDITNGMFRTETMPSVTALADGESYAYISDDGQQVVKCSFKTGNQTATMIDLNTARGPKLEKIDGFIVSPDGTRMLIQTETKYIYRRSFTAVYYIYSLRNNTLVPLSQGGPQQTPLFSPDGQQIAFVRDNNIWLVKLLYDNAESQVTKDGEKNKVINGIPDWVCEEEFSTNRSMVFSADGRQIVWVRYDETDVKEYSMQLFRGTNPSRDEYAQYPGLYSYKYPVPGTQNARVKVMSYDIKSHRTREMQLPIDADGYVARLVMTSDSSRVAVFTLNRHQDLLRIYMANPLSTLCQMVVADRVKHYIKEETFHSLHLTDRHMLLTSERSGMNGLYLYTLTGQLVRQVVSRKYVVCHAYGYDEATGDIYFSANPTGPTERQIMVSHKNGKTEVLTPKPGYWSAIFSSNYRYFIGQWSDISHPTVYTLHDNKGHELARLIDNQKLSDKLATYQMGTKELFSFTTSEGVQLNGWMVKPAGFDPQRHYPVIMYQYGGPGNQQVLNSWGIGMSGQGAILEQWLCQQGYVCVCVDGRGTGGRGATFEKCTYLRLGEKEARDQVETALWLRRQPWVDGERIGIWGWSYGGWNTLMSMSEGRQVFRCGVAIAPPTCWRYYDTVYTERYMRTPQENAAGYDEVNPIARAGQLHGTLLLCHGLADDNVHYQNTAEYVEALVQADKDFTQLVYTNRNHSIYGGNTRNHLFRQCLLFFNRELKPATTDER
ncbi:MAG: DPP IV N-terminal domain-containing protein [Prevotella sp.]|nr:DPP IV N-terminal domain-containing protein [Prevotella sp.]